MHGAHTWNRVVLAIALCTAGAALAQDGATVGTTTQEQYGPYLVDGQGMSLYLFKADRPGESTCYEACAQAWPPLLTDGEAKAAGKADPDLLGTTKRKDGSMQVTYGDWPLYYFVKDEKPGDTAGQDIEGFGAEWYLVTPGGGEVHAEGH